MSEVRERTAHAATLRIQRRQSLERQFRFGRVARRLRVHAQFLRLPLSERPQKWHRAQVAQTSVCGVS